MDLFFCACGGDDLCLNSANMSLIVLVYKINIVDAESFCSSSTFVVLITRWFWSFLSFSRHRCQYQICYFVRDKKCLWYVDPFASSGNPGEHSRHAYRAIVSRARLRCRGYLLGVVGLMWFLVETDSTNWLNVHAFHRYFCSLRTHGEWVINAYRASLIF
jgi:hypothetical protein